jgi:hypothetical protein
VSGHEALDLARVAGIEVRTEGRDLVLTVPEATPDAAIDLIRRNKHSILALLADPAVAWSSESWEAFLQERTNLLQVDHELQPIQARGLAFETCIMEWLARTPIYTTHDMCGHCSVLEEADDPLLPVGLGGVGEAWLHRACIAPWRAARRAAAITAFTGMGIAMPSTAAPFSVPQNVEALGRSSSA